jgi:hypothetical protein
VASLFSRTTHQYKYIVQIHNVIKIKMIFEETLTIGINIAYFSRKYVSEAATFHSGRTKWVISDGLSSVGATEDSPCQGTLR